MFSDLYKLSLHPVDLIIRALVVYFAVLLLLRLGGKKQMGQLAASEFVALLLISNAVQNSMNGGDNSLLGGLILAATLIFSSWAVTLLTYKNKHASLIFEGAPTLLIHKGHVHTQNLALERITLNELHTLLRKQGIQHFSDVHSAILEADGSLSIIRVGEEDLKPKVFV